MSWGKLARSLLRALAALVVLAAFLVLDWYPLVKELGGLRRQRADAERRIKNYEAMASGFAFPDANEDSLLKQSEAQFLQSLPRVESDGVWLAIAQAELLQRERGMANLIQFFSDAEKIGPGPPGLTAWLKTKQANLRQCFRCADPWRHFPWGDLFNEHLDTRQHLASQPLGIALSAPLPGLVDLINRVSWGGMRLEILCLHLELTQWSARAWIVCRGSYRVPEPSAWIIRKGGKGAGGPLIDPDSPLLLNKVDPLLVPGVEKTELPPPPRR